MENTKTITTDSYYGKIVTTTKKLDITGLYIISIKRGSKQYLKLMSEQYTTPILDYSCPSKPITKISDFIKLFNETLYYLDWTYKDFINVDVYYKAVSKMMERIDINSNPISVKS